MVLTEEKTIITCKNFHKLLFVCFYVDIAAKAVNQICPRIELIHILTNLLYKSQMRCYLWKYIFAPVSTNVNRSSNASCV